MIQIRNVPDDVHRVFKVRAAQAGMSLSDYLRRELIHIAETPTLDELMARIKQRERVKVNIPIEDLIREDRESH